MAYMFQKKIYVDWSKLKSAPARQILIVEPEDSLFLLYFRHLSQNDFDVLRCESLNSLQNSLASKRPDLCLINPVHPEGLGRGVKLLKLINKNFPALPVVTIAYNLSTDEIKQLMETGVVSHIDRSLTKPKDVVHIAKLLVNQTNYN